MECQNTNIDDCLIFLRKRIGDSRGSFTRLFCDEILQSHSVNFGIKQINQSLTNQEHTLRGFHLQKGNFAEQKLVSSLSGRILDIIIDLRLGSKTFLEKVYVELTPENGKMVLVPRGCAHAIFTLSDECSLLYFVDQFYTPSEELGLRWDDPFLGVKLPFEPKLVSDKDKAWPLLEESFTGFGF